MPGSKVNKTDDLCYVAFRENKNPGDLGNVWFLGTPFLSQYYTVFDASNLKN